MRNSILAAFLLGLLPTGILPVQVTVQDSLRKVTLFASITLKCDYSTSANLQDVLVTWRFKSYCQDPILQYFSTAYQAAQSLGQDPTNDCPDSIRTVRVVIQKKGSNEPTLGTDYSQRRITIQNKADLVIQEVMWWDNGVYYCSVYAAGDTSGNPENFVKLIVYNWEVVIFIILGFLLLLILLCVCWCQCCPQRCCCYVRCPCCPTKCCCPEKAVMRYKMMKDAQKAMSQWSYGQPIYAPMGSKASSQHPLLYTDYGMKQNIPLTAMPPPPPLPQPLYPGNNPNHVLDYIENQVRSMDSGTPQMQVMQYQPQQQLPPQSVMGQPVPFPPGPPSMISSLNDIGVREVDRRVIHLPPIMERMPDSSQRTPAGPRGLHPGGGGGRSSSSSAATSRSQQRPGSSRNHQPRRDNFEMGRPVPRRDFSPPRRSVQHGYSDDESSYNSRRGPRPARGGHHSNASSRREGRLRSRSRDDLMEDLRRPPRRDRSYSPTPRRDSVSSEDEDSRRGARGHRLWPEKPPSYTSIEIQPGRARNGAVLNAERYSDKSSRSGRSMVI
ncbi:ILDR1 protein, partial [Amia calva]|nr:ILDR1 protein [Amia calva]